MEDGDHLLGRALAEPAHQRGTVGDHHEASSGRILFATIDHGAHPGAIERLHLVERRIGRHSGFVFAKQRLASAPATERVRQRFCGS